MPTIKTPVKDVHEKFLLFQQCVNQWMEELESDFSTLEISEKLTSVREHSSRVIPFPNNGQKPHKQG